MYQRAHIAPPMYRSLGRDYFFFDTFFATFFTIGVATTYVAVLADSITHSSHSSLVPPFQAQHSSVQISEYPDGISSHNTHSMCRRAIAFRTATQSSSVSSAVFPFARTQVSFVCVVALLIVVVIVRLPFISFAARGHRNTRCPMSLSFTRQSPPSV